MPRLCSMAMFCFVFQSRDCYVVVPHKSRSEVVGGDGREFEASCVWLSLGYKNCTIRLG